MLTFLVSSMLGMGLSLMPRALAAPLRDVRFVLIALGLNFILAPAFAYGLTAIIPLEPPHALGLVLLGCAAGAPFVPKLVETARGDVAQSIALMTLLTVGTTLFLPLVLPKLATGLQAGPWDIARPLIELILLPLAVGLVMHNQAPLLAARVQPFFAKLTNVSVLVLLITVVVRDFRALLGVVGSGAIAAAILLIAGLFAAGYWLGGPQPANQGVLGLTTAGRNIGAAMIPASHPASDPKVVTMLVVGTLVILFLSLIAAAWLRRQTYPNSHSHDPA